MVVFGFAGKGGDLLRSRAMLCLGMFLLFTGVSLFLSPNSECASARFYAITLDFVTMQCKGSCQSATYCEGLSCPDSCDTCLEVAGAHIWSAGTKPVEESEYDCVIASEGICDASNECQTTGEEKVCGKRTDCQESE